jgi:feruloyl esterase
VPKLALLAEKVMAKCDAVDGLKDGLIDDPRKCSFDAKVDVPACRAGADGADCLTSAQAEAIMKIYSGPVSNGKPFFPGYMLGSEAGATAATSNWSGMISPAQPNAKPADFNLGEGIMRYLAQTPPKPEWDYLAFDYDRDISMLDDWSKKADAKNTDLSKFKKEGGKLLMTYGWSDQILQPMMGVKYFEEAVAKNGPSTTDFFRLFMVPGMSHCSGGIGTDRFDSMTALINWVEKNKAPDSIAATRVVNNQVVRSRPLCPYPQVARYSGQGSIDESKNFSCVKP